MTRRRMGNVFALLMRWMVRARAIPPLPVKPVFPQAAQPFPVPKYSAPEGPVGETSGSKQAAHHNSAFERAAVPIALEQDGAAINRLPSKNPAMVKLAL